MAVEGKTNGRKLMVGRIYIARQWARKTLLYIRAGACTRRGLQLVCIQFLGHDTRARWPMKFNHSMA